MKPKHPLLAALITIGWTIAGIVGVFIIMGAAIISILGDESAPLYFFSYCFALFAPLALVTAIIVAIWRFARDRRGDKAHNEKQ